MEKSYHSSIKIEGYIVYWEGYRIEFDNEAKARDFVMEMIKNGYGEGRY